MTPGNEISEEDRQGIDELRSKLIQSYESDGLQLTVKQTEFCDDFCLRRFLRARDMHVGKALDMLRKSLSWREEWRPEEIQREEIQEDMELAKMYMQGFDREQRPVVILRPGKDVDHGTIEHKVRFYVWVLEYSIARMKENVEQMTWLVDMNGYGVSASDAKKLSLAQALLTTLQDNYPERVGKMILVNPPWYFRVLFGLLRRILSQKTLDKIIFSYPKKEGDQMIYPEVINIIDEDNLEKCYGGNLETPTTFDHFFQ